MAQLANDMSLELQNLNAVSPPDDNDIKKVIKAKEAIKQLKQIGLDAKRQLRIWEDILSGALTSFKLTAALVIVFVFYILYTIFNLDNDHADEINEREEDIITCSCKSRDHSRYTALLYTFSILWIITLLLKAFWDCFQFYNSKIKKSSTDGEVVHKREMEAEDELQETLNYYEKSLIIRYLSVYSVGAKQNSQGLKLPHPQDVFDSTDGEDEDTGHTHNLTGTKDENKPTTHILECRKEDGYFQCGLSIGLNLIYYFILTLQTIAQMGLVPMMLLLFLDSYAWICITGNKYCRDERSEYELSLDQTAIAFGFYGCILLSALTNTMLKWFKDT